MDSIKHFPNYKIGSTGAEDHVGEIPDRFAGKRIDQALAILFPDYSRSRLQQWIRDGYVTVDGKACSTKSKVWGGEKVLVRVPINASEMEYRPEKIPLNVIYEDEVILVIDKPAGLIVHPGSGNWGGTLLNALLQYSPSNASLPRAGIVHRLDKDTSGLLVVAKTLPARTELVRQMQARSVGREYVAIVHGSVKADGSVEAPIGRHPRDRKRMAVVARGKPATTHYKVVENGRGWAQLVCRLETGRTHQIRVHLSSIGHALIGDPVYGPKRVSSTLPKQARSFQRQALHAQRLRIQHPTTGQDMEWQSPLPEDLAKLLASLRDG
ncbi:MAG: 23S rRNA pseudouridine(1911/1915/1917) synthase RluD [Burkholderiales bacterium]|nr:23S rRNA pseudouridine(1911/1915/1917) synthase RluD [Burkholderiales bacterium]